MNDNSQLEWKSKNCHKGILLNYTHIMDKLNKLIILIVDKKKKIFELWTTTQVSFIKQIWVCVVIQRISKMHIHKWHYYYLPS